MLMSNQPLISVNLHIPKVTISGVASLVGHIRQRIKSVRQH